MNSNFDIGLVDYEGDSLEDAVEEWEIAMEESARDDYLAEASMFDANQIFSRNL